MRRSIKKKFALLIFLSTALVSTCLITAGTIIARKLIDSMYKDTADYASYVAAANVDPNEVKVIRDKVLEIYYNSDKITSSEWGSEAFDKYQALYESIYDTKEYQNVLHDLMVVQDNINVDCIYIFYAELTGDRYDYIYLVDADHGEPCPIGCIDSYEWADTWAKELIQHPDTGLDPYLTKTDEYGWLISNMRPIIGDNNETIAYACTDVSVNEIKSTQNKVTIVLILMAIVILTVIYTISTYILNRTIVKPIKELSEVAENYWADGKSGVRNDFAKLKNNSTDEIGVLTESMKKMETDINNYFIGLETTKQELGVVREESEAIREMANKNGLTGVRNKNAYNTEIEDITEAYRRGKVESYGIAMIDLNFLKAINDTYGHEKGDVSIKKICGIVCTVFDHSPVFRIGGDEFAVILINNDLKNIDHLVEKFKKTVAECEDNESLEPWERVSAAIGYAVYEEGVDSSAKDVFARADSNMYADKTAQRAQRV